MSFQFFQVRTGKLLITYVLSRRSRRVDEDGRSCRRRDYHVLRCQVKERSNRRESPIRTSSVDMSDLNSAGGIL